MPTVREFAPGDAEACEKILKLNGQLSCPEIDGKEAMLRVYERQGRYFLVVAEGNEVVGMVRGTYDGSRALMWQLSVHPDYQGRGIGKGLVSELLARFKEDGSPTVSVTSTLESEAYYSRLVFNALPLRFMLADIAEVMKKIRD